MKRVESKQPRKQRKYRANADLHLRRRMMRIHISKELRKKLGTTKRTILVRKGDKVRLLTGAKKGYEGKVIDVDYKRLKIYIEGLTRVNSRGEDNPVPVDPSNVELVDGTFDKDREVVLKR